MSEFVYKPLDENNVDIASDPESSLTTHLGIKKSLFIYDQEEEVITGGPIMDHVNEIIELIRPFIKADGGDVEVIDIKNKWLRLKMHGECGSCSASASTLLEIEQSICEEIPEIKGVEAVQD